MEDWTNALFTKLAAIYGTKWNELYPTEMMRKMAKGEWAEAIKDLSVEQIANGLHRCRTVLKWPPTPAEFVIESKVFGDADREWAQAYKPFTPALPKPPVNPTVAEAALAEIRSKLGKGGDAKP